MLILTNEEDKMSDLQQLEQDKRDLQEALEQHKATKYKLLYKFIRSNPQLIFSTPLLLLIPVKNNSKGMLKITNGENMIYILVITFLVLYIWGINQEYNNYKNRIFDIEYDIEVIDSKIAKLKEVNQ